MSLSKNWIEIIVLYSILFIICIICCIKFCCWRGNDEDDNNVEIPIHRLPLPTIHEVVELTEIVPEKVELQIIEEEEKEEIEI